MRLRIALIGLLTPALWAQSLTPPVLYPRWVRNAFSGRQAPAAVAQGGLLELGGENLGPAPTQVLIHGTSAPVISASSCCILVQVPPETPLGWTEVVVRKGDASSDAVPIFIRAVEPTIVAVNNRGFGEAESALDGRTLKLRVHGLGISNPPVPAGTLPLVPATPLDPVRVYVGGIKVDAKAVVSPGRLGEYELSVPLPEGARPGDVIALSAGPGSRSRSANLVTYGASPAPETSFVPMPAGAELVNLTVSPQNGDYVVAFGQRGQNGCHPSWIFDLRRKRSTSGPDCLSFGTSGINGPVIVAPETATVASLEGPVPADAGLGQAYTRRVRLFNPAWDTPRLVELPEPAFSILGVGDQFIAVIPTDPPRFYPINAETGAIGAVLDSPDGSVPSVPPVNIDGLTQVVSRILVDQQTSAVLVTDGGSTYKFGVVRPDGTTLFAHSMPAEWNPLVAAGPASITLTLDPDSRRVFLLARATSGSAVRHGLIVFTLDDQPPRLSPFPAGAYVAPCLTPTRLFRLESIHAISLLTADTPEPQTGLCQANGFLQIDLDSLQATLVRTPDGGQFNSAATSSGEMNDYLYAFNGDVRVLGRADRMYVFDAAAGWAVRIDTAASLSPTSSLQAVPELNLVFAVSGSVLSNEAGFVLFHLESGTSRHLPAPAGYTSLTPVGVFPATRKLAGRATKVGGGSEILIFDIDSGEVTAVPNPPGIVHFGPAVQFGNPSQPLPGPARLLVTSERTNKIVAVGVDAESRQLGVVGVTVH